MSVINIRGGAVAPHATSSAAFIRFLIGPMSFHVSALAHDKSRTDI